MSPRFTYHLPGTTLDSMAGFQHGFTNEGGKAGTLSPLNCSSPANGIINSFLGIFERFGGDFRAFAFGEEDLSFGREGGFGFGLFNQPSFGFGQGVDIALGCQAMGLADIGAQLFGQVCAEAGHSQVQLTPLDFKLAAAVVGNKANTAFQGDLIVRDGDIGFGCRKGGDSPLNLLGGESFER